MGPRALDQAVSVGLGEGTVDNMAVAAGDSAAHARHVDGEGDDAVDKQLVAERELRMANQAEAAGDEILDACEHNDGSPLEDHMSGDDDTEEEDRNDGDSQGEIAEGA